MALLALLVAGCCCTGAFDPVFSSTANPEVELEVLEALLRSEFVREGDPVFVVGDRLMAHPVNESTERPEGISATHWARFLRQPANGRALPAALDVGVRKVVMGERAWWALPEGESGNILEGRWDAFHERYPGNRGRIQLGTVTVSSDGTRALTTAGRGSGWMSYALTLYALERVDGVWRVTHRGMLAMA